MREIPQKLLEEYMEVNNELVRHQRELLKKQQRLVQTHWESTERFRKVFNSQPDAIFILDNGIPPLIVDCNPATQKIFQYDQNELVGRGTDQLFKSSEQRKKFRQAIDSAMANGELLKNYEFEMKRKDGTLFPSEHTVLELLDDSGRRTGWISIVGDLTEKKAVEKQLKQAEKIESLGRLTGGVAHDLNNLLGPILGYADLLLDELPAEDPRRDSIEQIFNAGGKAAELVRQLLAFSRKQALKLELVDLPTLINDFSKLLRRILREDIELVIENENSLPVIQGDKGQIEQIIMNLFVNAQDAVSGPGTLLISTSTLPAASPEEESNEKLLVALKVADDGSGIDPEIINDIYDPFFTTKEEHKGTGLGLASVYGIVKQHGWDIQVRSTVGVGTEFTIFIPGHSAEIEQRYQRIEKPAGKTEKHRGILVVEDNHAFNKLVTMVLRRHGFTVFEFSDPAEALHFVTAHEKQLDILLTDLVMPTMDGNQLYEEVKKKYPGIELVLMSGYAGETVTSRVIMKDNIPFLQKPFNNNQLLEAIINVLNEN